MLIQKFNGFTVCSAMHLNFLNARGLSRSVQTMKNPLRITHRFYHSALSIRPDFKIFNSTVRYYSTNENKYKFPNLKDLARSIGKLSLNLQRAEKKTNESISNLSVDLQKPAKETNESISNLSLVLQKVAKETNESISQVSAKTNNSIEKLAVDLQKIPTSQDLQLIGTKWAEKSSQFSLKNTLLSAAVTVVVTGVLGILVFDRYKELSDALNLAEKEIAQIETDICEMILYLQGCGLLYRLRGYANIEQSHLREKIFEAEQLSREVEDLKNRLSPPIALSWIVSLEAKRKRLLDQVSRDEACLENHNASRPATLENVVKVVGQFLKSYDFYCKGDYVSAREINDNVRKEVTGLDNNTKDVKKIAKLEACVVSLETAFFNFDGMLNKSKLPFQACNSLLSSLDLATNKKKSEEVKKLKQELKLKSKFELRLTLDKQLKLQNRLKQLDEELEFHNICGLEMEKLQLETEKFKLENRLNLLNQELQSEYPLEIKKVELKNKLKSQLNEPERLTLTKQIEQLDEQLKLEYRLDLELDKIDLENKLGQQISEPERLTLKKQIEQLDEQLKLDISYQDKIKFFIRDLSLNQIENNVEGAYILNNLGFLADKIGLEDLALVIQQKAYDFAPREFAIINGLAYAYGQCAIKNGMTEETLKKAHDYFQLAVEWAPYYQSLNSNRLSSARAIVMGNEAELYLEQAEKETDSNKKEELYKKSRELLEKAMIINEEVQGQNPAELRKIRLYIRYAVTLSQICHNQCWCNKDMKRKAEDAMKKALLISTLSGSSNDQKYCDKMISKKDGYILPDHNSNGKNRKTST